MDEMQYQAEKLEEFRQRILIPRSERALAIERELALIARARAGRLGCGGLRAWLGRQLVGTGDRLAAVGRRLASASGSAMEPDG